MPSAPAPVDQRNRANSQKSQFQQTICLVDWWLTKAENGAQGRGLAVAGSTSRERQAVRVFSSAPILKRYDVCNLETTDGVYVILDGLINKDHTLENGFPSNVCDYFCFGFPPYWKEYHDKVLVEGRQMPSDSHEKDFVSQGKMNAKGIRKSKKVESGKNNTTKAKFDSLSEKAKAFGVKTKRKLAYDSDDSDSDDSDSEETPDDLGETVPSASPESISISKSRSVEGRQMPSDSHEKDFVSQGKMNAKGIRKSKKVESGKNNTTKAKFDSLSEKAKAFGVKTKRKMKTKRKLACDSDRDDSDSEETSDGKEKTVPSALPESIGISKSRSGRLLMPTLEFWRNQRAVYDVDRSITGIEQGIDEQPIIIKPQIRAGRESKNLNECLAASWDH